MASSVPQSVRELLKGKTLVWLRRDLRLKDHNALSKALQEADQVVPVFIFDSRILDQLEDRDDARVHFIHEALQQLQEELIQFGTSLVVLHGDPIEIYSSIEPAAVYTNRDYEPYARERDKKIAELLGSRNITFKTFKDHVVLEPSEVLKDDGTPYTIYTPFSKKWKALLKPGDLKPFETERHASHFAKIPAQQLPSLESIGFKASSIPFPPRLIRKPVIRSYHEQRDMMGIDGTSKLSVHLRFGTVSIRQLVRVAQELNEKWLNELIWREFYQMILWYFPHVERAFKPAYDQVEWRNDPEEFAAWCEGRTGYPVVDAGMRELAATGYMHNRSRMITASFLTKHLLIDWRLGERWFARKLLDFDLASNNGGWQWASGSGCDAAPYFRVFNPSLQAAKFDPENTYVRRWVPEFNTPDYPAPIVDHAEARARVLQAYKFALGN